MSSDANFAPQGERHIHVREGRVASIDLYEVKEGELEQIESGLKDTALDLTFCNILCTAGITSIVALATSVFKNDLVKDIFTFVAIFGTTFSVYFFIRWWRKKSSTSSVVNTIRARIGNGSSDTKHQASDNNASPS